jgi:amino acid adenylation domain-containing protein
MGDTVELKERSNALDAPANGNNAGRVENTAPLSFAQQQIWLHAQLVPEIPIYNEPVTIHRRGRLDVAALERTLTEIICRHEAWRTVFTIVDGEPVQTILPPSQFHLRAIDLRDFPVADREAEAKRLAVEDSLRLFKLSEGPLFRALLVHLSDVEHRLILTLHHIIFDGYSIYRVLLPELATIYDAFANGKPSPLPELPTQYRSYAAWERQWLLSSGQLSSQLAYWRKQLGGDLPVQQLPSDRQRPAVQSFRGAIHPVVVPKDISDALKLLSRREGATLFMGLISAFAVLLHRYSFSDDLPIGTVSSGRKRSELETLLGYFLNLVVLRNNLSGDPTFRQLIRRTREVALDALSNDDAPFTNVVSELHPNRSLSFNPLFQVLLTLEPPVPDTQGGWTVALTQSEVDTGYSKLDLCLELDERPAGLVGRFKYSTDLFDSATIVHMAEHFIALLRNIIANPDRPISQIEMLTAAERKKLCREWNDTSAEMPAEGGLHELFRKQSEHTPDEIALIDEHGYLTYRELDEKSEHLAAYLQQLGVGPESPVGLYFEPSQEMAVCILAVLKAGGACLPLDPSYPAERHAYVLADSHVKCLLTHSRLRAQVPANGAEIICVDSLSLPDAPTSVHRAVQPENLAYLVYTSGSTGRPKGVQITHANLVHSTHARSLYYGPEPVRFLLLSSFSFDSSLAGIFGTLCQGGTLVMTPGSVQSNLMRLASLVERHKITHLLCVPSLYSLLLEQAKGSQLDSLRTVIVAGESCPSDLTRRHFSRLPQAALYNEYGPTEATVWSTVYKIRAGFVGDNIPVGRPIPNARVYVLDPHMNPVPVGVRGELYVGGLGVARGYHNQPAETREKFLLDIFCDKPGARLYRTGDLVRYLADGNLEFLGRLDHQVKIRGLRIELEEIEARILEHKNVRQTVVTFRQEGSSEPELVAHVVPADPDRFDAEEIRHFLGRKLPDAMLPSAVVMLEKLPLMANGKVNRLALIMPSSHGLAKFAEPETPLEADLLKLWQEVLGKSGFGVTENFFDLGGHSLLIAKLLLRIEQSFGRRLSLADVFQLPTVRQLSAVLERRQEPVRHPAVVPVQPLGSRPALFWVRGGSFLLPLAKRLGSDQPLLGLHLPAADACQLPAPYTLEDIADAMIERMQEVQPHGPYYIAGLCVNGVIAYEMAQQLIAQGEEVALLGLFDAQNPAFYQDFSQEGRFRLLWKRAQTQFANLKRQKLSDFAGDRLVGIRRHLSVRYWRIHNAFHLRVNEKELQDLDTIVHPASFDYRPGPHAGGVKVVFFQSTDWPDGQYWQFHASWDGLITEGMKVFRIPGGHESMFYEENVDTLADKLKQSLSEAMRLQADAVA